MSGGDIQPRQVRRLGDYFEGRLERVFEHDRNAVWRMLTEGPV